MCLHLRQIMYMFWIFVFLTIFSTLARGRGGLCPLPFPLPPSQKCRLPRGKACTLAQGGGGMGGGSFLVQSRTRTGPCPFSSLWGEFFGLHMLGLQNATLVCKVANAPLLGHYNTQYTVSTDSGLAPLLHQYCISTANTIPIYQTYPYNTMPA